MTTIGAAPQKSKGITEDTWALLAGMRFLLATIVVFTHLSALLPHQTTVIVNMVCSFGAFQAVAGFFFISGLSIANSVTNDTKYFYVRRYLRIAPLYLACFLLSFLPWAFVGPHIPMPGGIYVSEPAGPYGHLAFVLNMFCLQGWVSGEISTFNPSWSLGCEVVYYALAPFFLKLSDRMLLYIGGTSFLLYMVHANASKNQVSGEIHGIPHVILLFLWLAGFVYYRHSVEEKYKHWLPYVLAVLGMIDWNTYSAEGGLLMITLGLITAHGERIQLSGKFRKLLSIAGGISYPLYLCHFVLLILVAAYIRHLPYFGATIVYIGIVAIAAILYFAIDVPISYLAKRILKSKRPVLG